MITVKVDDRHRVQIRQAKPGQVLELQNPAEGHFVLTLVKGAVADPFPPDYDFGLSLEKNRELKQLAKSSSLEVPE